MFLFAAPTFIELHDVNLQLLTFADLFLVRWTLGVCAWRLVEWTHGSTTLELNSSIAIKPELNNPGIWIFSHM